MNENKRLLKKVCSFKVGVLVLSVCSILLVLAVPQSIQAYKELRAQQSLDIIPWIEARGIPFLTLGIVLSIAWAMLIIMRLKNWDVKIPKTAEVRERSCGSGKAITFNGLQPLSKPGLNTLEANHRLALSEGQKEKQKQKWRR